MILVCLRFYCGKALESVQSNGIICTPLNQIPNLGQVDSTSSHTYHVTVTGRGCDAHCHKFSMNQSVSRLTVNTGDGSRVTRRRRSIYRDAERSLSFSFGPFSRHPFLFSFFFRLQFLLLTFPFISHSAFDMHFLLELSLAMIILTGHVSSRPIPNENMRFWSADVRTTQCFTQRAAMYAHPAFFCPIPYSSHSNLLRSASDCQALVANPAVPDWTNLAPSGAPPVFRPFCSGSCTTPIP
jgi:hypothetical protein